MGFLDSIESVVTKSFDFRGRAPRSEYWFWSLFQTIVVLVVAVTSYDPRAADVLTALMPALVNLLYLGIVFFLPTLAVTVRRLHDTGRNGWYYFVTLVPYIGIFILLFFMILPGMRGGNPWGANPLTDSGKGRHHDADIDTSVVREYGVDAINAAVAARARGEAPGKPRQSARRPAVSSGPVAFGKR